MASIPLRISLCRTDRSRKPAVSQSAASSAAPADFSTKYAGAKSISSSQLFSDDQSNAVSIPSHFPALLVYIPEQRGKYPPPIVLPY